MQKNELKKYRFSSAPVIAALVLSSGASVFACSLSTNVEDVLQPENGATSTGTSTSGAGVGGGSSTSGSSSGTASGGGAGTGGAGTGGAIGGPEACTDGNDNDGDGAVDCADTDCQPGFECTPAAPAGFSGPLRVDVAAFPGPAPAQCDDGSAPENFFAGPAGPAQCSACTCSDVMGASCSAPSMSCWAGSTNCMSVQGGTDWTPSLQNAACNKPVNLLGIFGTVSCLITAPGQPITKGSCTPSPTDFANKESWQSQVSACKIPAVGGGCGNAEVCIPKSPNPTPTESICIKQDGASKQCPAGYSKVIDAFSGGTDTRGCGACACGDANVNCSGSYTFYDLNACATMGASDAPITINSNQCKNVSVLLENNPNGSWSVGTDSPLAQASCPPSGGQPTGSVNTQGPVTFCCK